MSEASAETRLPSGYTPTRYCELRWAKENLCAPFSNKSIFFDLGEEHIALMPGGGALTPSLATVCALYGVDLFFGGEDAAPPLWVQTLDPNVVVLEPNSCGVLPLERGRLYSVHISNSAAADQRERVYRIKDMLSVLRDDRIRQLSRNFYERVYADDGPHAVFRALFAARATLEEAIANQADFLIEIFGITAHNSQRIGEDGRPLPTKPGIIMTSTPYSDRFGEGQLVPRTIGKHHAEIMNLKFARRWLEHMMAAVNVVFEDDAKAALSLIRYFNHFLAFFEFAPEDRVEICKLCSMTCNGTETRAAGATYPQARL
eukprot:gnl/TRDRNA2_/TRDRNA2_92048_c0_seq2.p1 gnl/TRDRNA2_/TRDRNA2_92048_c0~~gnl/TRDRNA2_/TRDRNA2_92048_c0_seq2.p1  ORF type:complete len:316 (-),score=39.95 gnl/TRDRNA2_/TRDRNA2_92048_c0_seq2:203-1150(-)